MSSSTSSSLNRASVLFVTILALFTSISISKSAFGSRAILPRDFCALNRTHTVTANETCTTIAQKKSVSTNDIIALNCLDAQCTNLKLNSTIHLPGRCDNYTVKAGDTCNSIASSAQDLTLPTFWLFNPGLSTDCSNLLAGDNVCISAPHCTAYFPSNCSAQNTTVPTVGAAPGANSSCFDLHTAQPGDNCNNIAQNYSVTVPQFLQTNPSVNQGCTNLVTGLEYCIPQPSSYNITFKLR